jgi:hypothetical protein
MASGEVAGQFALLTLRHCQDALESGALVEDVDMFALDGNTRTRLNRIAQRHGGFGPGRLRG